MYEVFINNKRLVFDTNQTEKKYDNHWIRINPEAALKNPDQVLLILQDVTSKKEVVILTDQVEITSIKFFKSFKQIDAAGGLVKNTQEKILLIFRNDKWDLPKGKIEQHEKPADAALREVCEETGIKDLKIIKSLPFSLHVYLLNNKKILKKTFWFEMFTANRDKPTPQAEEGITEVKWMNEKEISKAMKNSYALINNLIEKYHNQKTLKQNNHVR